MSETTTKKKKYASNFQTACCDTQRGASHFLLDEGCVRALWMPMSLSCFCFLVFFSHSSASANLIYNHEHQMNVYDRTWPGWWDLSWFIVSLLIVRGQASRGQWSLSLSANRFRAPVRLLKLCPSCFPSFSSGNLKEIYSLEGKLDWLSF